MKTGNENNSGLPGWKRALDIGVILLALPMVLPVALIVVAVIRATSSGPILFQQERVGYRGRRFMCFKFRTMHCGSDTCPHQGHLKHLMKSDAPMIKMDLRGDSRIIPLGRLLRASGLDELPQLLNVLAGDMSLVGPRPCLPYEAEQYQPWQLERFAAVPGLTGLWQVSGKNRTTFMQMVELDIQYAKTKNLWLDMKIMILTPQALVVQLFDLRQPRKLRRAQSTTVTPVFPVRATNDTIFQ